jgi:hypothetical protein
VDHIADVWAALETYDRMASNEKDNYRALARFVVMCSFPKISARFHEDKRIFGGRRLFEVIKQWKPDDPNLIPQWVPVPPWLCTVIPDLMPEEGVREVGGQVEWKLLNETLPSWATLLAAMHMVLDESIQKARGVMQCTGKSLTEDQCSAISDVHHWCNLLYHFIFWDQQVVQFLMRKTTLLQHLCNNIYYADGEYHPGLFTLTS